MRLALARWFGRRRVEEVGALRKVLREGVTENELVRSRWYAGGGEFLEMFEGAGCKIEYR